jgi:hypothetical protein
MVSSETNTGNAEGSNTRKAKKVAFADEPNFMTGGVGTENDDRKSQSPVKTTTT